MSSEPCTRCGSPSDWYDKDDEPICEACAEYLHDCEQAALEDKADE